MWAKECHTFISPCRILSDKGTAIYADILSPRTIYQVSAVVKAIAFFIVTAIKITAIYNQLTLSTADSNKH